VRESGKPRVRSPLCGFLVALDSAEYWQETRGPPAARRVPHKDVSANEKRAISLTRPLRLHSESFLLELSAWRLRTQHLLNNNKEEEEKDSERCLSGIANG